MARSISFGSTKSEVKAEKTINPYSQPCFTLYTMSYSHGGGFYQYDHNYNLISAMHGTGDNSYSEFRTYSTSAHEVFESTNSYHDINTDRHVHSYDNQVNGTNWVGYLGNISLSGSGSGAGNLGGWGTSLHGNGSAYRSEAFRDVNSIVGETKQDYALFSHYRGTSGQELWLGPRSANIYYSYRRQNHEGGLMVPLAPTNNAHSMYGSGCYNKNTNKYCFMQHDTDGRHTPVVYSGVPDMRMYATTEQNFGVDQYSNLSHENYGVLRDHFNDTNNRTVYNEGQRLYDYSGHAESSYRCQTCLCDNGKIVTFHMTPHDGAVIQRWNADGTHEGVLQRYSWTTSYGYEQGSKYGSRFQVSSDGRYMWSYCPSYYYGSGMYFVCVRVSDGKVVKFSTQDSTYGRLPYPVGKCGMGFLYTSNTDGGTGAHISHTDWDYVFAVHNDQDTYNPDTAFMPYTFECGTYSTAYPSVIPCMYDTSLFTDETYSPKYE
jgi:hypothetical protein